ncbi:MAG: nicotinate-nucleotide--dimethylbenzimidazole phosphoribosyltransferase [gamma proteobacterium symbiont of Bathyaustriella thionipta]|nr:nicotinate-nucleotide--dimethylbenzimidazole phosphoribosyltransferase [gamma proteobacterium symbiont of Bathyaustriella thionipta]MCU7949021.1 nicotinate-nucleotide--dimethylbenzimidazole phosphoribosyltransferase [gamma proteobacterium symbiont of Bathyaustriella thionipta]MCU7954508.1 nicotinate-nucleotide--dimethylbenzimidazole phosphoribosyltransferase [gamma proteobacterium symbiont of Bathyaustriella thionipta]MCU7955605.1 nicotinate-nucleotide--dimethylbenzimidazole phosphoribosyltra
MSQWLTNPVEEMSDTHLRQAQNHQNQLTKPQGSLGVLEAIAVTIAALQKTQAPCVNQAQVLIYAADHGIAQENVSAFPQAVTAEMVKNFSTGGAAICVLAHQHGLPLQVINMGLVSELPNLLAVEKHIIAKGTNSFLQHQAMSAEQLMQTCNIAKNKVDQAKSDGCELLIPGEMGIANTTSATALVCALEGIEPEVITGAGTGLDDEGVTHKINIIKASLKYHKKQLITPLKTLQFLGGFEIAALTATYIRCAQQGVIALVDGFICSVAALFAIKINPQCKNWLIFSHQSAEQGHKMVLERIGAQPLLEFNMRLGEASGAALTYPLIRSACLLHNDMASFASADVSEKLT